MTADSTIDDSICRARALESWFQEVLPSLPSNTAFEKFQIKLIQGDASFRRYFRAQAEQESFILVDAPPQKEDSQPFIEITEIYSKAGVKVPQIYATDLQQGFLCLLDFGDTLLWEKLNKDQYSKKQASEASELYQLAFEQLLRIQKINVKALLPAFSEQLMLEETDLFKHWFCEQLLGLKLDQEDERILTQAFSCLMNSAQSQPQLCVHRDYHSRNLLYTGVESVAVIDYQDAVIGPFTYDLVSLLKDCYIAWPREQVIAWALEYFALASAEKLINLSEKDFLAYFDLMGAQRHLKAIGIFSRLYLRDGKINYLGDIPRTLSYLCELAGEYKELDEFLDWIDRKVMRDVEDKIVPVISKDVTR